MLNMRDLANGIRFLSMDAVQKANSGHPGMPMGMADIASVLWLKFLKHNPSNPKWFNRDRFVLSNGHGSMLLYSLLHLSGYDLSLDELRNFRQLHSQTPGHPEYGDTAGVETTTGPLGQGLANAVGMAIAEKVLARQFNQEKHSIIDHYTYVFCGDGCLMEGISHEACSLAGTLGLGKLIAFYDDNGISIDGKVDGWFKDDTAKRFEAYGWHVIDKVDGHSPEEIEQAIIAAQANTGKPTLICCKTHIGYGSPNFEDSEKSHGSPLGDDEIQAIRTKFEWSYAPFEIPSEHYSQWNANEKGAALEQQWQQQLSTYKEAFPQKHAELERRINGKLPQSWSNTADDYLKQCCQEASKVATRKASQNCLNAFGPVLPELLGGSADLAGSNNTIWSGSKAISHEDFNGNYIYYGVREFGMAAIMNGLALHSGFIPYGGTFLVFSDYARNAIRLSAMMKQRVIYVLTHDSIGLGEDGPTHQPVEHAAMLRLTPGINVWRPADALETAVAWRCAIESNNCPSALLLSRQGLPSLEQNESQLNDIGKGAYIVYEDENPDTILIATGSEVHLAVEAAKTASAQGYATRVISMPSCDVFDAQSEEYKQALLPSSISKRIAIEAAAADYWYKYVGLEGKIVGLRSFGLSAPAAQIYKELGICTENIIKQIKEINE
jgi:transketolase